MKHECWTTINYDILVLKGGVTDIIHLLILDKRSEKLQNLGFELCACSFGQLVQSLLQMGKIMQNCNCLYLKSVAKNEVYGDYHFSVQTYLILRWMNHV